SSAVGTALGTPSTATLTIVDDDGQGVLQFDADSYSVGEGDGHAMITVTRTGTTDGTVRVHFATSNGTATSGSDYTAASGTLTFSAGVTSKTFVVRIINDTRAEPDETINLTLSNPTNHATLGTPSTATITILDNDRPGTLQFSSDTYSVN